MFFVIEGIDGSGKTTVCTLLDQYLKEAGYAVKSVREPGSTMFGEEIRNILFKYDDLEPLSQLLLFSATRCELNKTIESCIENGIIVLMDRYVPSSYVYQRKVQKTNPTLFNLLISDTFMRPDITFILDIPASLVTERIQSKEHVNHYDRSTNDIMVKRARYLRYALDNDGMRVIDANRTPQETAMEIYNLIIDRIERGV